MKRLGLIGKTLRRLLRCKLLIVMCLEGCYDIGHEIDVAQRWIYERGDEVGEQSGELIIHFHIVNSLST